jgi:hypothetical protein
MTALMINILILIIGIVSSNSVIHEIYFAVLMCAVSLLSINFNISKK